MTSKPRGKDASLILVGLNGSNPLAFLAALGTLRTLTLAWPDHDVAMRWVERSGAWRPAIVTHGIVPSEAHTAQQALLEAIEKSLVQRFVDHSLSHVDGVLGSDSHAMRQVFREICSHAEHSDRQITVVDWLSAISSDCAPEATSQLQTVRRDYFVGNLKRIIDGTEESHLRRTLFQTWDYADPLNNQSLHWDPSEDRRHALQWNKPSGDRDRMKFGGMLGANRLAIEAIPLFQSIPVGDKLSTCGFSGTRADNTRWTWPLWTHPLTIDSVPSLLSMLELQVDRPEAKALRARGIAAAFRCRRILVEKTPNFSPAQAV